MKKRRKPPNPHLDLSARLRGKRTWRDWQKGIVRYYKDIDTLLVDSIKRLDNTGHQQAAIAWRAALQSKSRREKAIDALIDFAGVSNTNFNTPYDALRLRNDVIDIFDSVDHVQRRADRLHKQFGTVKGVPKREHFREPVVAAANALIDLAATLQRMFSAIKKEHGMAHGTSPLASQLRGSPPVDRFALQLSEIWVAAGHTLLRNDRKQFEAMLEVLVEAVTGKSEIDTSKLIPRIKSKSKLRNSHPPK